MTWLVSVTLYNDAFFAKLGAILSRYITMSTGKFKIGEN